MIEALKLLIQLQSLDTQILAAHARIEAFSSEMKSDSHSLQDAQDAHDRTVQQGAKALVDHVAGICAEMP